MDIQLELFDYLVFPILVYGCEIWGYENITILDKLHLKFLKCILCIKQSTPICMVLGETGRSRLSIAIKTRMIYFWCKLMTNDAKRFSATVYSLLQIYNVIILFTWTLQEVPNINTFPNQIKQRLKDQYIE